MTPGEKIAKAARFKAWAESDGLYAAIDSLRDDYLKQAMEVAVHKTDESLPFVIAARITEKVKEHIESRIIAGKSAAAEMKDIARISERKKK